MKNEPLADLTATLLLTAFLVVTLGFAVEGTFETRAQITSTFAREAQLEQAQLDLEELLRLQIDEENSLRGYVLTRIHSTSLNTGKPPAGTTPKRRRFSAS